MSSWKCPNCKAAHQSGDFPDHWSDGCETFEFECECGVLFEIDVEWSPQFRARSTYVKGPMFVPRDLSDGLPHLNKNE